MAFRAHSTPRILTFNFHEPYLCLMAKTGISMDIGVYESGPLARAWQTAFRPKPSNLTEVGESHWRREMMSGSYDLIIAHNEMNAIDVFQAPCAKLLVCHNRRTFLKTTVQGNEGDALHRFSYLLQRLSESFQFVFISESKRDDYGLPGRVILPGVDVEEFGGYTGREGRVLRVGNLMQTRDWMFDVGFQETVSGGLPQQVAGINPGIAGAVPAASYEALLDAYRHNRCLLHVTRQEYEDGYNLAMIEALACGMPVVSLGNRTSPLTDGVDGFVSYDAPTLRRRLEELLADLELGRAIGAKGRETVARTFPLARFVEGWREAIFEGMEQRAPQAGWRPRAKPPGQKSILLHYVSSPLTTGRYLEQAAQPRHEICSVGFRLPKEVLSLWGFAGEPPPYPPHRISTAFDAGYGEIVGRLPAGYQADFYLFVDSGPHEIAPDLSLLRMPKVAYLIDTHVTPDLRLAMARPFDLVFLAQKGQLEMFRAAGIRNIFWLPLACSPELHQVGALARQYDVAYVGSFSTEEGERRNVLLGEVSRRFPNHVMGRFWPEEMARIYGQSKIVVNAAYNRDVNMRVFEALASGALLITDEAEGLEDLFQDGEHLVIYRRDEELPGLIERYLSDGPARERIAQAGQERVLREHTYAHRIRTIVEVLAGTLGTAHKSSGQKQKAYYACPRRELLPFVPHGARRVLDVGCGAGAFGRLLKEERGVKEVAGLELEAEAAEQARAVLDDVLTGNLEEMELPYGAGHFDCIICADVLEHLKDPAGALRKLGRVLSADGTIVMSIPNVQFHDVVAMLSQGYWTYAEAGILDNTHLRFFTRKTLRELIQRADLEAVEIQPLNMRDPERFPRSADGSLQMGKLHISDVDDGEYENFLVYQYVAIVRKPSGDRLMEARGAYASGQYELAVEIAGSMEECFEQNVLMAKALAKLGRLADAEAQYLEALRQHPEAELRGEYGVLLVAMNRIEEAMEHLEAALAAAPEQDRIQGALGLALLAQGRSEEAFGPLRQALESTYEHFALLRPFAGVCEDLERLNEAVALTGRFAEYYPGNVGLACLHAEVLMKMGRFEEARAALGTAELLAGGDPQVVKLIRALDAQG